MNENQAMRKTTDRVNSLRDFRYESSPHTGVSRIEMEARRVNAATAKEEATIGPPDPHPSIFF
jgi:hypothetical protein